MRRLFLVGLTLAAACSSKSHKATEIDMRSPEHRTPAPDPGPGPEPAPAAELPSTTQVGNAVPDGVLTINLSAASIAVGDELVGGIQDPPTDTSKPIWIQSTSDALVKAGGAGAVIVRGTPDTPFELVDIAAGGAAGAGHSELAILALGPDGKPTALPACAPTVVGTCQGQSPSNPDAKHFLLTLSPGGSGQLAPVSGGAPATALTTVTPDAIATAVHAFEPTAPTFVHVVAQPGVKLAELVRALAVPSGTLRIMIGGATVPGAPKPTQDIAPHPTDMPPGVVG